MKENNIIMGKEYISKQEKNSCIFYDEIPEFYHLYKAKPDESIYEHTVNLLKNLQRLRDISYIQENDLYRLIKISCIYHDIGKINPLFQERLKIESKKFDANTEIGHNILSAYLVKEFLKEEVPDEDKKIILHTILNHHQYVNNFDVIRDKKDIIDANLQRIAKEVLQVEKDFSKNLKKRSIAKLENFRNYPSKKAILVKGFLHKCDYIASAKGEIEIPNIDLIERLEKMEYHWNEMQKFAKENSDQNIVLIGSTGLGKTEASLLWLGNHKGFYVLPLKTAINAMYERMKKDLYPMDYSQYLGLLHGDMKNIYLKDMDIEAEQENEKFWKYYEITRSLALPLTITTPDQIFRFAFKYPSYELQLATYSYSKIIIDEIQAYSPDILAILIYGLQRIYEVGGKFAIMTATLPPFIKELLQEGYDPPIAYQEKSFLNPKLRHKVKLEDKRLESRDILSFISKKLEDESMKILVVVNTIKESQKIYKELKENMEKDISEDIEIYLLHSKFILQDRNHKELKILQDGKTDCKKKVIWVTTQVVEASLDIDFDYLFTELSDLSGLFQRMGRCNRKGEKEIGNYNIFVYLQINPNLFRVLTNKNAYAKKGFIFKSLFALSQEALITWSKQNISGEMSEEHKKDMIDIFFTMQKIKDYQSKNIDNGSSYLEEYNEAYTHLKDIPPDTITSKEVQKEFRNILSVRAIPKKVYIEEYTQISKILEEIQDKKKKGLTLKKKEDKFKNRIEILNLKEKLYQFTVAVELYQNIYKEPPLEIEGEKVYICDDNYNSDIGLSRKDKDEDTDLGGIFI